MPLSLPGSWRLASVMALALASDCTAVYAQTAAPGQNRGAPLVLPPVKVEASQPTVIGGRKSPQPRCAAVEVAGQQRSQANCAAQKLEEATKAAQAAARGAPTLAVPDARSGDTRIGVANLTASEQRLGASLKGATKLPQRPSLPPPATSFPRKP
jgi:hypothetical protein